MSNVSIYKFENNTEIRVVEIGGNPWFVALDVCRALDVYTYGTTVNTTMAVKKLAADEYRKEEGLNRIEGFDPRAKTVVLVSESGLYKLIMRSDKPEARRFQDCVTRDVLPAIRKDGAYILGEEKVATGELDEEAFVLKAIEILQRKIDRLSSENKQLTSERDGLSSVVGQRSSAGMTD